MTMPRSYGDKDEAVPSEALWILVGAIPKHLVQLVEETVIVTLFSLNCNLKNKVKCSGAAEIAQ